MDPPLLAWSFSLMRYNAHARITRVSHKAIARVLQDSAPPLCDCFRRLCSGDATGAQQVLVEKELIPYSEGTIECV